MSRFAKLLPPKIRARLDQTNMVQAYRRQKYAGRLRSLSEPGTWTIDHVEAGAEAFEIRGWAIAPQGDYARASFLINETEFNEIEYPFPRTDIEEIFWYYPGADLSGFVCRAEVQEKDRSSAGYTTLKYVDKFTGKPFGQENDYFFPDKKAVAGLPIPDAARRARVHGGDSESSFLIEGFTTYKKLGQVLKKHFNREYDDFARILDWGCGCGRMTRYFNTLKKAAVTGVDIDADNIQWDQQHLGFGRFLPVPPHPPTGLPAAAYDLLIGISIFTHLGERDQYDWLEELARIAADGAILLMTVHGDTTVCRSELPGPLFYHLQATGFLDVGLNPNLAGVLEEQDFYRNTYHTRAYIEKNWSAYFDIVDILPGFVGNHQDLVILRK